MEFGEVDSLEEDADSAFALKMKQTEGKRRPQVSMLILDSDAPQNPDEIILDDDDDLCLSMTEGVADEGEDILRGIIRE